MKLIILLILFTFNAYSAFIPSPTSAKTIYGTPLIPKGSLMTSDGVNNGSSTVCADDEILVWDAAEASGTKCEAKPVAVSTTVGFVFGSAQSPNVYSNNTATYTNIGTSASGVVVPTGAIVELDLREDNSGSGFGQNGGCQYQWMRNGADIGGIMIRGVTDAMAISPSVTLHDTPSAGTYTYTIKAKKGSALLSQCVLFRNRIVAKVYPQ